MRPPHPDGRPPEDPDVTASRPYRRTPLPRGGFADLRALVTGGAEVHEASTRSVCPDFELEVDTRPPPESDASRRARCDFVDLHPPWLWHRTYRRTAAHTAEPVCGGMSLCAVRERRLPLPNPYGGPWLRSARRKPGDAGLIMRHWPATSSAYRSWRQRRSFELVALDVIPQQHHVTDGVGEEAARFA